MKCLWIILFTFANKLKTEAGQGKKYMHLYKFGFGEPHFNQNFPQTVFTKIPIYFQWLRAKHNTQSCLGGNLGECWSCYCQLSRCAVCVGEQLVHATIRQIMAARAIHNVFKMTESTMSVTSEGIRFVCLLLFIHPCLSFSLHVDQSVCWAWPQLFQLA